MGSNPVQAWIFFRLSFRNCLSCVYNCDDHSLIHSLFHSSNVWIFIYSLSSHLLNEYITNSHNDQLPVGLIAQLVEHCSGIAEVIDSNLRLSFRNCLICVNNFENLFFYLIFHPHSKHMFHIFIFTYSSSTGISYELTIWPAHKSILMSEAIQGFRYLYLSPQMNSWVPGTKQAIKKAIGNFLSGRINTTFSHAL